MPFSPEGARSVGEIGGGFMFYIMGFFWKNFYNSKKGAG